VGVDDVDVDVGVDVDEVNGWLRDGTSAAKGLKMYKNQVNCLQDVKKVKPVENMAEESAS